MTDTFHGAAISVSTGAQFAAFVRDSNRNKLGDLLERFGLEDRAVTPDHPLREVLERPADREKVRAVLREERNRAAEYLQEEIAKAAEHG